MSQLSAQKGFSFCLKNLLKAALLFLLASPSFAQTYVSGNQSGLWTKANSPYIMDAGGFTVPAGQTLLVEPGVEIRSTNYYDRVVVNGTLIAQGTVSDSIRFTNYSSNGLTYEGSLYFAAGNENCVMDYVSMDLWGYNYHGDAAAIYIQDGSPTISHSRFANCNNTAIYISNSAASPNISNTIFHNTPTAINITNSSVKPVLTGLDFTNTSLSVYTYASQMSRITNLNNAAIILRNSTIDTACRFPKFTGNSYYNLEGGFTVGAATTLTIDPGVQIRSTYYYDRITINGTLIAQGTSTDSIRFVNSSNYGLAKEGSLFFAAGNVNCVMEYVSMDSWGYNYYGDNAAVYIQDGSPTISQCRFARGNNTAIYISNSAASPNISSTNFHNTPTAINIASASAKPVLTGLDFTNTSLSVYTYASQMPRIINLNNAAIILRNSTIDTACRFPKFTGNSYYNLEGGFTVGAATTLTIDPGVQIRSTYYYDRITINGTLIAQGTSTDSIRFTNSSNYGLAQEGSLFFAAGNVNCVMEYVSMDSWGYNYYGDAAAVYIQDGSPTISQCRFARGNNTAIYISNGAASPNISNTIFHNTPTAINIASASAKPVLTGLDFTNTSLSVYTYALQMSRITNLNNAAIILRNSTIDSTCRFPKFTGNSYYNLEAGFTVGTGTTLTIDPGVQIRSTYYYDRITVNGTLIARGTATDSIRFLNYSNYGLSQEGSLIFAAGNTNSVMDYVVMDRWGYNYYGDQSAVDIQSGAVPITNCSFRNGNSRAINCSGSGVFTVSNTDFVNNPTGIYISGSSAVPTISAINISGSNSAGINVATNGINPYITGINFSNTPLSIYTFAANMPRISNLNTAVITLKGSTIDSACTMPRFPGNSYYNIEGEITLAASKTLTIKPGVEIRSTYYYDRLNIRGTLVASGTATDSIKFLNYTNYGLAQEGALNFTTGNTNSVMDYVLMDRWGYNYHGDNAAVNVQDGKLDITHSTFKNSNNIAVGSGATGLFNAANVNCYNNPTAMYVAGNGGTPVISGINISNSSSLGINVAAGGANPYISGATFSNTPLAVYTFASDMPRISNLTNASVTLKGSTIDSACTMPRFPGNSYYNIEGQIIVAPATTLTIMPGVDIRSTYYYDRITINGTLIAQGTAADSIRFFNYTNYGLAKEGALIFGAGNFNCVMDYVSMDKWGYNYLGDNAAVNIQSGDVAISHSTFKNSNNMAVLNSSATSRFSFLDLISNPTGFYNTNGSPVLTNCSIFNNSYGVYNGSGTADTVDARNCYWGTATGPYHPTLNPAGTGNQVSDRVKFIPWTAQPYIFSFAPTVGSNGDTVVIKGDKLLGITSVTFGGVAAKSYTIVSDSIIIAIVDTGSSGFVAVTSPGGPASKDGFIFCTPITPTVLITSNKSDTICKNVPVTFTATISNGGTSPLFFWTRNGTPISGATAANYATDSLNNNDVIQCFLLSNEPCASLDTAASNTKTITVNQPTFSITNDTICAGSTYTFNGNGYTTTGTYVAHLTNAAGCDSTATLNLYVKANSSSVTTASICPGDSVLFNGAYYKTQGIYPIHFINTAGCDSIATLDLTVKATSSSTTLATICHGDSYPFNGTNYTTGGTYTIHFTNSVGCDSAAILVLTVNPIVTPSVIIQQSPASPVCTGSTITFSAVPANGGVSPNYQWKVNGVSVATGNPFITSSLQNNDTVTCTLTSSETCVTTATTNSNAIIVNIATTPVISILASADSVCPGQNVTLTASGALTYSWAAANGLPATTGAIVNANPTAPTTYTVTGYNGCTATATISIGLHDVPVANAGSDQTILRGSSATLTATGGLTYLWNTGDTSASVVVSPTNTTDYMVTSANQFGCTSRDTVRVNVNFSSLTINNASHNYGDVVLNTPVAFTLQITNNGTLPINIDSALVAAPFSAGFITQSLPAGNTLSIPVTFNPPATLIYQQNLLIKTAVGNYQINLRGRGVNPAPAWTVAPVSIDYGNVVVGSNPTRNFLVTNTGNVAVTLDSLLFSNAVFTSSTSTPASIAVGGNKIVAVSFSPVAISPYSDNLKVKSTTNGLNPLQVALSGFGYVPGTPPQIKFVQSFPYNGTDGVNPVVGQPGLYTYRIIYKSATNIPPQNGYPKVGIDKSGDGDFIDPSEGIYAMTKVDSTTDWINGEAYTFSATLANGNNYGYQFFAKDSLGNVATATNVAYQSGPVVTNQTLDLSIYANDITFSKQNPAVNETFTAFATVHNNTPYSASNVNIRFYTDSIYYGETTLPYIGPNGTAPVSLNLVYNNDGFYPIKVWIDSAGLLGETNALNNYAIRPIIVGHFTVPGAINVTATSSVQTCPNGVVVSGTAFYSGLNLAGTPPVLGANVTVTVTDNFGNTVTSGSTYTVTGGNWNIYFGGLSCGSVYNHTATVTDYTLTGSLSNPKTFVIPCVTCDGGGGGGTVDNYSISNSTSLPPCLINNQPFVFTTNVANSGNKTLYNDTLKVYADGTLSYTYLIDSLVPSQVKSFGSSFTLPTGNHTLSYNFAYRNATSVVNDSSSTVINVQSGLPDLYLTGFSQNNVGFAVQNVNGISCSNAAPTKVYIYDSIPNAPSYSLVDSLSSPALGNGNNVANLGYDFSTWSRGQHYLLLRTDGREAVPETNEDNNTLNAVITIKPDLYITQLDVSNSNVKAGDVINFTATVKNRSVNAGTFKIEFNVGNTVVGAKKVVSGLAYNNTVVVISDPYIVPSNCPDLLKVKADADDEVDELDETNNVDSLLMGTDLISGAACYATGSSCNPYTVPVGGTIRLYTPVSNIGNRDADTVGVRFVLDTTVIGYENVPHLAPGASVSASVLHTFNTPGLQVIAVNADYDNKYCETNEANNNGYIYVQVQNGLPDLRVLSQDISPSNLNPNPGQAVTIVSSVHNIGVVKSNPVLVRFEVDGVKLGNDVPISTIYPGQDTTVSATATYTGNTVGPKIIKVWVDSAQTLAESDISNNAATRAIIVGAAPDFAHSVYEAITFNTTDFKVGDTVQICNYIRNYGGDTGSAVIKFYAVTSAGRQLISSVPFTLKDRDSIRLCTRWKTTADSGRIVTEISGSAPPEFDILNNDDSISFKAEKADTVYICANGSTTISAPAGYAKYRWNNGETSSQITVGTGTYTVVATDGLGTNFTTKMIRVLPYSINITLSGSSIICHGSSVVLTAPLGDSYLWNTGATTQSIVADTAKSFSVTVTRNGCSSISAAVNITFRAVCGTPQSRIAKNITNYSTTLLWRLVECATGYDVEYRRLGDSAYIVATATDTVLNITNLFASTTYEWRLRTVCGKLKSKYTLVKTFTTLNGPNYKPNLGNDTIVTKCPGFKFDLRKVYQLVYPLVKWSTPNPDAAEVGVYTLIVGNQFGADTVQITVQNNPKPIIGNDTTVYICSGNARSLRNIYDTSSYASVRYSIRRPDIAIAGTYLIIVANQYGCEDTATITVLPDSLILPVVTASGPLTFCKGDSVTLTVGAGNFVQYNWNNGFVGNVQTVKNSGSYRVTVLNDHGCLRNSAYAIVVAQVAATPVITTNPVNVRAVCPGIVVTLTSSAANNSWSTGETTASINVTSTGNYAATTYDNLGCSASAYKPVSYRLCSPPSLYYSTVTSNFSAKVYWTPMPCALSYDIAYRVAGTVNFTIINVTDTFAMLTNLLSNTKYEWKVRVVCASGSGNYNNAKTFITASSTKSIYARQNETGGTANGDFSVSISPNPAKTTASLRVNGSSLPLSVSISSADGKSIWQSKKVIGNQINIPVADYEVGVYFLTVNNGKEVKTLRLVVEK